MRLKINDSVPISDPTSHQPSQPCQQRNAPFLTADQGNQLANTEGQLLVYTNDTQPFPFKRPDCYITIRLQAEKYKLHI